MTLMMRSAICLIICLTTAWSASATAGTIRPADLNGPAPETTLASGVRAWHCARLVENADRRDPASPPSVLGAVKVRLEEAAALVAIDVHLIRYVAPGSRLRVVIPNFTGSAWAGTDQTATVNAGGLSASVETERSGVFALFNPDRKAYVERAVRSRRSAARETRSGDEEWGLILENGAGQDKIPLILVHGDNSYTQDKDRWGDFLNWVADHPDVDGTYEIWRFHHDTRELIGYDGQSGNALELGDEIMEQFGADRPLLFLSHSRGGLVTRSYMCNYGDGNEGDRVLGLVTLGTPHRGSPGAVPDWGLYTVFSSFEDSGLADVLYGYSSDYVVNVLDEGTMGLAWDNFDGPEQGMPYADFSLEADIGENHVLSVMDANVATPVLEPGRDDDTIYIPDRAYGTLEELNADARHFGKIIAYGGYDADLGLSGVDVLDWLDFSFGSHGGLVLAAQVMANMQAKVHDTEESAYRYAANDGMVPLQSALLLHATTPDDLLFDVDREGEWYDSDYMEVNLRDFSHRLQFRKSVICPDFDHLHMAEGKGGALYDKSDYWDHVAGSLDELAGAGDTSGYTPAVETFAPESSPSVSDISSGDNCFIRSASVFPKFR